MATQTVAQHPHVVQFPQSEPAAEIISQTELALLLSLRGRLAQLESQLTAEEESLKTRLQAGAVIEPGDHTAELKENSRRSVAWKEVCIRLTDRLKLDGEMFCARVPAATKPTKTEKVAAIPVKIKANTIQRSLSWCSAESRAF
jgi:hypothetical protein